MQDCFVIYGGIARAWEKKYPYAMDSLLLLRLIGGIKSGFCCHIPDWSYHKAGWQKIILGKKLKLNDMAPIYQAIILNMLLPS